MSQIQEPFKLSAQLKNKIPQKIENSPFPKPNHTNEKYWEDPTTSPAPKPLQMTNAWKPSNENKNLFNYNLTSFARQIKQR